MHASPLHRRCDGFGAAVPPYSFDLAFNLGAGMSDGTGGYGVGAGMGMAAQTGWASAWARGGERIPAPMGGGGGIGPGPRARQSRQTIDPPRASPHGLDATCTPRVTCRARRELPDGSIQQLGLWPEAGPRSAAGGDINIRVPELA